MTKIKNTKKGMAKKTLSISLAVAMLATSNVPVWAAEFTDGSDATFTSEAPVEDIVEEVPEVEAPAEEDTQDAKDISAPKSTMKIHESGWANDITVDGHIYDKNGKKVNEFQFAWVVDGLIGSKYGSDYGKSTNGTVAPYAVTSNDIGKEVELHIFDVNTDPVIGNADYVFKTNTVTVSKVNVDLNSKSKKMTVSALGKEDIKHVLVYTGKTQYYDEIDGGVTAYAKFDNATLSGTGDFEYSTTIKEGNGVDIGSVYTVVATPKDSSKYTGSLNYDYTIVSKDFKEGDITVTLDKKYEYTGNLIKPAVSDVTVKDNLKNTVLDSARVVENVTAEPDDLDTSVSKLGKGKAYVTLHNVPNFTEDSFLGKGFSGDFEVVARDLSNVDVVIDAIAYTGEVLEDNDNRFVDKIHFFDKETGEELNLDIFNDYTIHVAGKPSAGTKTYNIELKANNENTKNYKSLTFTLGNEDFSSQGYYLTDAARDEIEKSESYTGKDITKDITKIAFEDEEGKKLSPENYEVKVYGKDAGKNAGKVVIKGLKSYEGCEEVYYFDIKAAKFEKANIQSKVVFVKGYTNAAQYAPEVTVTAVSDDGKTKFTLDPKDYTVDYRFKTTNMIGETIISKIQITNKNFKGGQVVIDGLETQISKRDLSKCTATAEPGSYVYTGAVVKPTLKVMDGNEPLAEGVDYEIVSYKNAKDVGTATVVIKGIGDNDNPANGIYDNESTLSVNYEITPAKAEDIKVELAHGNTGIEYTGNVIKPTIFKVTLNGNDVSKQFDYYYPETNVNVGTGHVILKPVTGNKNFTGQKDAEFQIIPRELQGTLKVYDEKGQQYTVKDGFLIERDGKKVTFAYDGEAHTFARAEFIPDPGNAYSKFVTADDYEIVYIDNVYGKVNHGKPDSVENGDGVAYIAVIGKRNFKGGDEIINAADEVVNVVDGAAYKFKIKKYEILKQHVTVEDGEYAAGQPVRPNVKVVVGGKTLVENKDYKLVYDLGTTSDLTNGKTMVVSVQGINGYRV